MLQLLVHLEAKMQEEIHLVALTQILRLAHRIHNLVLADSPQPTMLNQPQMYLVRLEEPNLREEHHLQEEPHSILGAESIK